MKRNILIIVILAAVGWAVYDFVINSDSAGKDSEIESGEENETAEVGLEEGNRAPDFELETMDGDSIKLSDLKGKKVMVNFWATWCPPCRAEIPDLQEFYEDTDINILAVNVQEEKDKIEKFSKNFGMEFPILLDRDAEVSSQYNTIAFPTSFIIDSDGIISYAKEGAMNYDLMIKEYEKLD